MRTTTTAKIHIDARQDLSVACLPTTERAVASLERALRHGCDVIAAELGITVEYVGPCEDTDALGRAIWQQAHCSITVGPRGGARLDAGRARASASSIEAARAE